jgi:hypothetical protein
MHEASNKLPTLDPFWSAVSSSGSPSPSGWARAASAGPHDFEVADGGAKWDESNAVDSVALDGLPNTPTLEHSRGAFYITPTKTFYGNRMWAASDIMSNGWAGAFHSGPILIFRPRGRTDCIQRQNPTRR